MQVCTKGDSVGQWTAFMCSSGWWPVGGSGSRVFVLACGDLQHWEQVVPFADSEGGCRGPGWKVVQHRWSSLPSWSSSLVCVCLVWRLRRSESCRNGSSAPELAQEDQPPPGLFMTTLPLRHGGPIHSLLTDTSTDFALIILKGPVCTHLVCSSLCAYLCFSAYSSFRQIPSSLPCEDTPPPPPVWELQRSLLDLIESLFLNWLCPMF